MKFFMVLAVVAVLAVTGAIKFEFFAGTVSAGPLTGRRLVTVDGQINLDSTEPCRATTFRRTATVTVETLRSSWEERCAKTLHDFFEFFRQVLIILVIVGLGNFGYWYQINKQKQTIASNMAVASDAPLSVMVRPASSVSVRGNETDGAALGVAAGEEVVEGVWPQAASNTRRATSGAKTGRRRTRAMVMPFPFTRGS